MDSINIARIAKRREQLLAELEDLRRLRVTNNEPRRSIREEELGDEIHYLGNRIQVMMCQG